MNLIHPRAIDKRCRNSSGMVRELDRILGFALGLLIVFGRIPIKTHAQSCLEAIQNLSIDSFEWFQTARPAGVKLHVWTCSFLSTTGIAYTRGFAKVYWLLESLNIFDGFLWLLSAVLVLFGLEHGLRLAHFLVAALVFPVTVLVAVAKTVIHSHLMLVRILWGSMRGDRSSGISSSYGQLTLDVDPSARAGYHLAISCLLFMPVVLTLPTVLWYGYFVSLGGNMTRYIISFIFHNLLKYICY